MEPFDGLLVARSVLQYVFSALGHAIRADESDGWKVEALPEGVDETPLAAIVGATGAS